jgi:hypothetical protein
MYLTPEKEIPVITGLNQLQADALKKLNKRDEDLDARAARRSGHDKADGSFPEDKVSLGAEKAQSHVYAKPIAELQEARFMMLRDFVSVIFRRQGISFSIDIGGGRTEDLTGMSPEKAAALVADGGYWGVEQTSDRIVEFALSAAGGDPQSLERVKEGVTKGFEQAKRAFSMALPEISQKTYDAVMKKLDAWANEHMDGKPLPV